MEHIHHAVLDSVTLLPLLFLIYLLIEYLEHENNNFINRLFIRCKKAGAILGGLFGTVPQCGFSVIAAELFSKRAITLGTMMAIFIATSDEAVPLMIAHPDKLSDLGIVLGVKFLAAVLFGFLVDLLVRNDLVKGDEHAHPHFHGNCESCDDGILKSALRHTVKIFIYILIMNILLGFFAEKIEPAMQFISQNLFLQSTVCALFGMIPNCAASVFLTELYLAEGISLSALIAGLTAGGGVGVLVLLKKNKNLKENIAILLTLFAVGVITGVVSGIFI